MEHMRKTFLILYFIATVSIVIHIIIFIIIKGLMFFFIKTYFELYNDINILNNYGNNNTFYYGHNKIYNVEMIISVIAMIITAIIGHLRLTTFVNLAIFCTSFHIIKLCHYPETSFKFNKTW